MYLYSADNFFYLLNKLKLHDKGGANEIYLLDIIIQVYI